MEGVGALLLVWYLSDFVVCSKDVSVSIVFFLFFLSLRGRVKIILHFYLLLLDWVLLDDFAIVGICGCARDARLVEGLVIIKLVYIH